MMNTTEVHKMKVTKYTRAGRYGKVIRCPKCNGGTRVYHFAWSGLSCQGCKLSGDKDYMIDKYNWELERVPT